MFFARKNREGVFTRKMVAIIGTSSLAKFLAAFLQDNGAEVVVLVSPNNVEKYRKIGGFSFRNTTFQNRCFDFNFVSFIDRKVDYCFLASRPFEAKNDLLLLNNHSLKGVCCINFSSFYNYGELEKMKNVNELRGYFENFLVEDKNEIQLLNRNFKISLCGNETGGDEIRRLLNKSGVDIVKVTNNKGVFEQKLAVFALMNLILQVYDKNVSSLLDDSKIREQIDLAIKEYCSLRIGVDASSILPNIYVVSDSYKGEFTSKEDFMSLCSLFDGVDYFETPILYNWILEAAKKY